MNLHARLVLPAIRWDAARGYATAEPGIAEALALGVGGFILFGGTTASVRELTARLRAASPHPLLIASDLERGAGQQIEGLTPLPPLAALAALGVEAVREAARMTAREARSVGINFVLAPVADLDLEPDNPIVQARSFGADAFDVAHLAAEWIAACQSEGVLACVKHFPGHGRTTMDSHAGLPVVPVGHELGRDIMPFRRAVAAGVAAVMTAHVAYPKWDAGGAPATWSRALVHGLLRRDLYFDGLVVTDALIMEGARVEGGGGEGACAARVIEAGGDLLLYPHDPQAVVSGLEGADVLMSLARLDSALRRLAPPAPLDASVEAAHRARGEQLASAAVRVVRGEAVPPGGGPPRSVALEIIDDDAGGPYPLPPRTAFAEALGAAGVALREDGARVVLLFADVKGWKGRAGLSEESRANLAAALRTPATVVVFGHPRRAADVPGDGPVLCAWSGDVVMQRAAAASLLGGS